MTEPDLEYLAAALADLSRHLRAAARAAGQASAAIWQRRLTDGDQWDLTDDEKR